MSLFPKSPRQSPRLTLIRTLHSDHMATPVPISVARGGCRVLIGLASVMCPPCAQPRAWQNPTQTTSIMEKR